MVGTLRVEVRMPARRRHRRGRRFRPVRPRAGFPVGLAGSVGNATTAEADAAKVETLPAGTRSPR